VTADGDLADAILLVEQAHLDAVDREADRAGLSLAVAAVEGGDRRGLREAVPLGDLAAELLLERAHDLDRLEEDGRLTDTIAGLAKLNNTRKARQVIAEARDMLGGNGVLLENHVIRHMGDIEVIHIYEGTETMQTLIVGRDITGVGAFA
jgi:alkylation response protein AidB-like acyl-CoA dehydrogenase